MNKKREVNKYDLELEKKNKQIRRVNKKSRYK